MESEIAIGTLLPFFALFNEFTAKIHEPESLQHAAVHHSRVGGTTIWISLNQKHVNMQI